MSTITLPSPQTMAENFPQFNWDRFWELDMIVNTELWHGPDVRIYFEDNPPEHVEYRGYEQAVRDLNEMLGELPGTLWYDLDGECVVTDKDPNNFEDYWERDEDDPDAEPHWVGGAWAQFSPKDLLYKEVRNHI